MPLIMLFMWLNGVVALAVVGGGGYLIYYWYRDRIETMQLLDALGRMEEFRWTDGIEPLLAGILLLVIALFGRPILMLFLGRQGTDDPESTRTGESHRVTAPDGTELQVELYGPENGVPI